MAFRDFFAAIDGTLLDVLGDEAVIDIAGDGSVLLVVQGEFDAPWLSPRIGQLRTDVLEPMFTVQTNSSVDLSGVVKGVTKLAFEGKNYLVLDDKPDSTGLTVYPLRPLD